MGKAELCLNTPEKGMHLNELLIQGYKFKPDSMSLSTRYRMISKKPVWGPQFRINM